MSVCHGDERWLYCGVLSSAVGAKRCDDDMQRKSASAVTATEWRQRSFMCVCVCVFVFDMQSAAQQ